MQKVLKWLLITTHYNKEIKTCLSACLVNELQLPSFCTLFNFQSTSLYQFLENFCVLFHFLHIAYPLFYYLRSSLFNIYLISLSKQFHLRTFTPFYLFFCLAYHCRMHNILLCVLERNIFKLQDRYLKTSVLK